MMVLMHIVLAHLNPGRTEKLTPKQPDKAFMTQPGSESQYSLKYHHFMKEVYQVSATVNRLMITN